MEDDVRGLALRIFTSASNDEFATSLVDANAGQDAADSRLSDREFVGVPCRFRVAQAAVGGQFPR